MENPNNIIESGSPTKIEPTFINHDPDLLHEEGVKKLENKQEDENTPSSQRINEQRTLVRRRKEILLAQSKVFETLKCPCCWKFVGVYFEQCGNSHTVCSQCRLQIPNCPICRKEFVGRPVVLSAIVEYLIQIFGGLTSGDKAIDAFLKRNEPTPFSTETGSGATTPETEAELVEIPTEPTVFEVKQVSKSVRVFMQQKSSMFLPPPQDEDF